MVVQCCVQFQVVVVVVVGQVMFVVFQLEVVEVCCLVVFIGVVEGVEIVFVDVVLVFEVDVEFECGLCGLYEFVFVQVEDFVYQVQCWDCCFVDVDGVDFFGFDQMDVDLFV